MKPPEKSRRPRRPAKAAKSAAKKPRTPKPAEKQPREKPAPATDGKDNGHARLSGEALEAELKRLADLPRTEYDRERKDAARRLNLRTETLDKEVADRRPRPPASEKPIERLEPPAEGVASARMQATGILRSPHDDKLDALPFHYLADPGRWYGPAGRDGRRFARMPDSLMATLLAEHGYPRGLVHKDTATGNTACDRAMAYLQQQHLVDYAGPLAGYRAGRHDVDGQRLLVTEDPRLIQPAAGEWPTITTLIHSLLRDAEGHPQAEVFFTWLASSCQDFWRRMTTPGPWPFRHCPALGIFGPRGCGKSALIDLVLQPLFGGRKGDPMTYLREQRFNKDIIRTELLALDDKGADAGLPERRRRGEAIKDIIWKPAQRQEGKGQDALTVYPFWRLVIAGNDDDAGLQVCPALSPSLADKLILLRASPALDLPATKEDNDRWAATIRAELPALAAALLEYRPPAELGDLRLDPRSRVFVFWHPDLVASLRQMQPELKLLEILDTLARTKPELFEVPWTGTATDFERLVRTEDPGMADRLFTGSQAAGRMLSELARLAPERVIRTNHGNTSRYRIHRPAEVAADTAAE